MCGSAQLAGLSIWWRILFTLFYKRVGFRIASFLRKGPSQKMNETPLVERRQIGHPHENPRSVDVLSAESAKEQSPGRKPRVGNFLSLATASPEGASERYSINRSGPSFRIIPNREVVKYGGLSLHRRFLRSLSGRAIGWKGRVYLTRG